MVRRNLQLLGREPGLYGKLLWRILRETWRSAPFLWRSLAVFPVAVRRGMELREEPADRIHAHWATHPTTAGWVMSEISGIPLSLTAHAHDIYLDQAMLPFKLHEAVAVLTCTRQNLDFLKKLAPDVPEGRIRLSYHGLDLSVYKPAAGAAARSFASCRWARSCRARASTRWSRPARSSKKRASTSSATSSATARCAPRLEARVVALGLKRVHFLGKQSQEKLPEIYRSLVGVRAGGGARRSGGTRAPSARARRTSSTSASPTSSSRPWPRACPS